MKYIPKKGDRIICSEIPNNTGTVVNYIEGHDYVPVVFDKFMDGHNLDGLCKYGLGWNCEVEDCEIANKYLIKIE